MALITLLVLGKSIQLYPCWGLIPTQLNTLIRATEQCVSGVVKTLQYGLGSNAEHVVLCNKNSMNH